MELMDPDRIGQLIHQTSRAWRHQLDERLRPLGLSQAKWRTIAHLARGHLTQCELAERLGIEEPTLARSLASMESDGWITRENARHDRRCKTVHLEEKSSALLRRIKQTAGALRRELVANISARDLQSCMRVLSEIRARAVEVSAEKVRAKNGNSREKIRKAAK
ncbi:MAG TPA: MarR family transcriptional regulator [Chthoniobacterales bacterium]|nr:MarR family transcriptional regulator [Chthoniobacterales bacterium]